MKGSWVKPTQFETHSVPVYLSPSVCSLGRQEDIWGGDASRGSPRFSLLILDVGDYRPDASPCAVVLIPRGRDREFTFSCAEGLEQVTRFIFLVWFTSADAGAVSSTVPAKARESCRCIFVEASLLLLFKVNVEKSAL